jgi:hypothetical protein
LRLENSAALLHVGVEVLAQTRENQKEPRFSSLSKYMLLRKSKEQKRKRKKGKREKKSARNQDRNTNVASLNIIYFI